MKKQIGEFVAIEMKKKNMSMKKLSDQIEGLSPSQVARVVNGENYKMSTLEKILNELDIKIKIYTEVE